MNPWLAVMLISMWTIIMYRFGHEVGRIRGIDQGANSTAYIAWASIMVTADLTYGADWFNDFLEEVRTVVADDAEQARIFALAAYMQAQKEEHPWQQARIS